MRTYWHCLWSRGRIWCRALSYTLSRMVNEFHPHALCWSLAHPTWRPKAGKGIFCGHHSGTTFILHWTPKYTSATETEAATSCGFLSQKGLKERATNWACLNMSISKSNCHTDSPGLFTLSQSHPEMTPKCAASGLHALPALQQLLYTGAATSLANVGSVAHELLKSDRGSPSRSTRSTVLVKPTTKLVKHPPDMIPRYPILGWKSFWDTNYPRLGTHKRRAEKLRNNKMSKPLCCDPCHQPWGSSPGSLQVNLLVSLKPRTYVAK